MDNLSKHREKKRWLALALIFVGVVGLVVIYILSTQIEATDSRPIQSSTVNRVDTDEQVMDTQTLYTPVKVYSFLPFVRTYHLSVIVWGLVIILGAGVFLMIYTCIKNKRQCNE